MKGLQPLVLVLGLLWPAVGALADDVSQCSRSTIKTDPLPDGRIRVPVTVAGRKLSFVLDTGGVASTIKWERAKELGLPVRQSDVKYAGVAGSLLNFYVEADKFSVADQSAKNRPLYIETRNLPDADGTLGPDILRDYDVEIDLAGGTLSLGSHGYCAQAATTAIPMDVDRNGHIRFPVKLDGKTIAAKLDTGSAISFLGMKAAAVLGIYPDSPKLAVAAVAGQNKIYVYPFESLEFGGVSIGSPHIAIVSDSLIPETDGDVILGMDAMRQMRFTIAYGEKRLLISTPRQPAAAP